MTESETTEPGIDPGLTRPPLRPKEPYMPPKRAASMVAFNNRKQVIVTDLDDNKHEIRTPSDFIQLLHKMAEDHPGYDGRVIISSSIDFPEEYTEDPELLQLCEWLRKS